MRVTQQDPVSRGFTEEVRARCTVGKSRGERVRLKLPVYRRLEREPLVFKPGQDPQVPIFQILRLDQMDLYIQVIGGHFGADDGLVDSALQLHVQGALGRPGFPELEITLERELPITRLDD